MIGARFELAPPNHSQTCNTVQCSKRKMLDKDNKRRRQASIIVFINVFANKLLVVILDGEDPTGNWYNCPAGAFVASRYATFCLKKSFRCFPIKAALDDSDIARIRRFANFSGR